MNADLIQHQRVIENLKDELEASQDSSPSVVGSWRRSWGAWKQIGASESVLLWIKNGVPIPSHGFQKPIQGHLPKNQFHFKEDQKIWITLLGLV